MSYIQFKRLNCEKTGTGKAGRRNFKGTFLIDSPLHRKGIVSSCPHLSLLSREKNLFKVTVVRMSKITPVRNFLDLTESHCEFSQYY